MSLDELDPVLVPPKRLAALGILAAAKQVDFGFVRDQLDISDSDLSKQIKALTDAGYATSKKTGRGPTRKTWLAVTKRGRTALDHHAAALRALISPEAGSESESESVTDQRSSTVASINQSTTAFNA